tara:strand:+ start:414 stop:653 length:240 start_codon:yes stop_codon:yes gene_type:complete
LGRTDNFIRQRLKLSGLIDGFKHFVHNGDMTISLGVGVAPRLLRVLKKTKNPQKIAKYLINKGFGYFHKTNPLNVKVSL